MLAALLCNQPYSGFGSGLGHYRRPNERFITQEEWLRSQEELTKFKALPKTEKIAIAKKAIKEVKASESVAEPVDAARDIIDDMPNVNELLQSVNELHTLLMAYYWIKFTERNHTDDIAALFMLGIL